MLNRISLRCASPVVIAMLAAITLAAGGCGTDIQIDGGSGGSSAQSPTSQTGVSTGGAGGASSTVGSGGTAGVPGTGTASGGFGVITSAGIGSSSGGPADTSGIALLASQLPTPTSANFFDTTKTLYPSTLLVLISDGPQVCSAPLLAHTNWVQFTEYQQVQVVIGLPLSLQKVGKYPLSSPDVIANGSNWTGGPMKDWVSSGPITDGTVEVLSIDTASIRVRLEGLTGDFVNQNGEHLATFCP